MKRTKATLFCALLVAAAGIGTASAFFPVTWEYYDEAGNIVGYKTKGCDPSDPNKEELTGQETSRFKAYYGCLL